MEGRQAPLKKRGREGYGKHGRNGHEARFQEGRNEKKGQIILIKACDLKGMPQEMGDNSILLSVNF